MLSKHLYRQAVKALNAARMFPCELDNTRFILYTNPNNASGNSVNVAAFQSAVTNDLDSFRQARQLMRSYFRRSPIIGDAQSNDTTDDFTKAFWLIKRLQDMKCAAIEISWHMFRSNLSTEFLNSMQKETSADDEFTAGSAIESIKIPEGDSCSSTIPFPPMEPSIRSSGFPFLQEFIGADTQMLSTESIMQKMQTLTAQTDKMLAISVQSRCVGRAPQSRYHVKINITNTSCDFHLRLLGSQLFIAQVEGSASNLYEITGSLPFTDLDLSAKSSDESERIPEVPSEITQGGRRTAMQPSVTWECVVPVEGQCAVKGVVYYTSVPVGSPRFGDLSDRARMQRLRYPHLRAIRFGLLKLDPEVRSYV